MKPVRSLLVAVACPVAVLAADLALKNGRVLHNAVCGEGASPDCIVVRHDGGQDCIRYDELPDDLAKAIRLEAGSQMRHFLKGPGCATGTASATDALPAPSGTTLSIVRTSLQEAGQDGDSFTLVWTATVANPTGGAVRAVTRIHMLDKQGFVLDYGYGDADMVPAGGYAGLRGRRIVKRALWRDVDSYEIRVTTRD
jgi:hypothetical protein